MSPDPRVRAPPHTIHETEVYAALWLGALAIAARQDGPFDLDVEAAAAARYVTVYSPAARA